jgi:putative restriction endonuclease
MGYSPLFGVFVVWEAIRHQDAAYSANMQVRVELLEQAIQDGWAVDRPRRTQQGPEVRAAVHPSQLHRFMKLSIEADTEDLIGADRQAFLLAGAPDLDTLDLPSRIAAGETIELEDIERARVEATGTRLKRAMHFSKHVLGQFDHRCAVCQVQLTILEAAHIIPVHDSKGSDEVWNGIALCRNHHRLFDRRILLIDSAAFVRANDETLTVLKETGHWGGYQETLGCYRNKILKCLPRFFDKDLGLTRRMLRALKYTYEQN